MDDQLHGGLGHSGVRTPPIFAQFKLFAKIELHLHQSSITYHGFFIISQYKFTKSSICSSLVVFCEKTLMLWQSKVWRLQTTQETVPSLVACAFKPTHLNFHLAIYLHCTVGRYCMCEVS